MKYRPGCKEDIGFLSPELRRHFNERPAPPTPHVAPLPNQDDEGRNRMQSNFSTLCRGHIIPKELDKGNRREVHGGCGTVQARIINDSDCQAAITDEIVGTEAKPD